MFFQSKSMTEQAARNILGWQYEPPYDFYNLNGNDEDVEEMLDGTYKAVYDEGLLLVGFYCVGDNAKVFAGHMKNVYFDRFIDFGLGLRPDLTGSGQGYVFCHFIIDEIEREHGSTPLRLTVATFNERAIALYKKLGFTQMHMFESARAEFITMVKK